MQVLEGKTLDVVLPLFEDLLDHWQQVRFSQLWSKDTGQLMDTGSYTLLNPDISLLREFQVKRLEHVPVLGAKHKHKSWEVETSVVADLLVVAAFSGLHIEFDDLVVDVSAFLKGGYEWTDVLERSASHDLRSRVFQEPVVNGGQLLRLLLDGADSGYFSHLVSTSFANLFLLVLCQLLVQREDLAHKEVKRDYF